MQNLQTHAIGFIRRGLLRQSIGLAAEILFHVGAKNGVAIDRRQNIRIRRAIAPGNHRDGESNDAQWKEPIPRRAYVCIAVVHHRNPFIDRQRIILHFIHVQILAPFGAGLNILPLRESIPANGFGHERLHPENPLPNTLYLKCFP